MHCRCCQSRRRRQRCRRRIGIFPSWAENNFWCILSFKNASAWLRIADWYFLTFWQNQPSTLRILPLK